MNKVPDPSAFYAKRISQLEQSLHKLYKIRRRLGLLRFVVVVITGLAIYAAWGTSIPLVISLMVAGIAGFLYLVSKDTDNKAAIDNDETLLSMNKKETEYAAEKYYEMYDGKDLEPENHHYAVDLDLFGKASLYQYINRCNAEQAKLLLAKRFLSPLDKEAILLQQEAVKALAVKPLWRQQLQAFGTRQKITTQTEKRVLNWLETEEKYFEHAFFKPLLYIFPVISLSTVYLYIADIINTGIFSSCIIAFYLIALSLSKKITPVYDLLSKVVNEISVLYKELNHFETETFESKLLLETKNKLKHDSTVQASREINQLEKILNRFDVRLNAFAFIILNTFFLWDLRQMMALKKWKEINKTLVPFWFHAIASIEVLNSLATLSFNHPEWCFPVISDIHFTLQGNEIGHPLIPAQQRINNSFYISYIGKVDLVTGSNMAGKSTFLRSLGINMILAYAGAPVCAQSFTVSISKLMSSMRITDNLAENTSTFYAELKKLKSIIEAVKNHEKIFIMLDEILRGTNSLDRHTGSAALIKQLIKENAVALIATHDVELAKLEKTYPANISNYHFDVQVAGEELYFDYKLKEGICTSLNASLLMKKIGIEL